MCLYYQKKKLIQFIMKTIRKHASKIAYLLALSILFISCSKDSITSEINESLTTSLNSKNRNIDGITIFKGIFFFQGDFAKNINALKYKNEQIESLKDGQKIKKVLNDFSEEVVNFIIKFDPKYFNNFKSIMQSGNNFEIQKSLINSSKLIELAGMSSKIYGSYFKLAEKISTDTVLKEKLSKIDVNTTKGQEDIKKLLNLNKDNKANKVMACTPGAVFCVYYIAALAVSYAAALYTAIAVANVLVYAGAWVYGLSDNSSEIETEGLVADISVYFYNN